MNYILLRKDSKEIRSILEQNNICMKNIKDEIGSCIYVFNGNCYNESVDTLTTFMQTIDCMSDENMFFDIILNDLSLEEITNKYKHITNIGMFPLLNMKSITNITFESLPDKRTNIDRSCIILHISNGMKLKDVRDIDMKNNKYDNIKQDFVKLYEDIYNKWENLK